MGRTNHQGVHAIVRSNERVTYGALVQDAVSAAQNASASEGAAPTAGPTLAASTSLRSVFDAYLAAKRKVLAAGSVQSRESHLNTLCARLQRDADDAARSKRQSSKAVTLADLTTTKIQAVVNELEVEHLYDARGKAVGARAVGTWLAETGQWYAGDERLPISVLYKLKIPKDKMTGRPIFEEHELQTIRRAATNHPTRPYLHLAAQRMDELGLRAGFEAMTLRLREVHLGRRGEVSFIRIYEDDTKTEAGAREVPIEPEQAIAFRSYLDLERPEYKGSDPQGQTFFLTEDGLPYKYGGWNSLRRRFKAHVERLDPMIVYKASRNRGTRARELRRRTFEDSEIMQVMGWRTVGMIRRYAGVVPTEELAAKLAANK